MIKLPLKGNMKGHGVCQLVTILLLIVVLTSCTVNITFTSTHGQADDVVDLEEKQETEFTAEVPAL
jgi:hypothetical protein